MATPLSTAAHAANQELILYVLGQGDAALEAHLATCESCHSRMEMYRSVLAATRDALSAASGRVNLVSLEASCVLEERECQVGDEPHTLRVTLTTRHGELLGRLTVAETCTCWQDAPVRLFGSHGLVASGRVDDQGEFSLPMPAIGDRYSLGLVLNRRDAPELQIIGNFQVL